MLFLHGQFTHELLSAAPEGNLWASVKAKSVRAPRPGNSIPGVPIHVWSATAPEMSAPSSLGPASPRGYAEKGPGLWAMPVGPGQPQGSFRVGQGTRRRQHWPHPDVAGLQPSKASPPPLTSSGNAAGTTGVVQATHGR